jgi:hypothetical protein
MNSISVSTQGGIVVRKAALVEKQISEAALLEAMEARQPDSANEQLLAFGPSFGEEAMNEFDRRLRALGLEYVDDFFFLNIDVPGWCALRAELTG